MTRTVEELISERVQQSDLTVACAESLTGGSLSARLAAAPEASSWFHGGVVAYTVQTKNRVLNVPLGPVITAACAETMATEVAQLLNADIALAVTGAGGPGYEEGQPPGTVYVAIYHQGTVTSEYTHFDGPPEQVVHDTASLALARLLDHLTRRLT